MLAQTQPGLAAAVAERDTQAMEPADLRDDLEALHPASFGWALRCCAGRRDEAEEVLQATYLKVLDGRARFCGRSSLKTWLFAVLRRTAAERRRHQVFHRLKLALMAESRPESAERVDPEPIERRLDACRRLDGLLERLAKRQREVLHLVFYQDLTIQEAARVMGVSLGTARTHYERGKQALRKRLATET